MSPSAMWMLTIFDSGNYNIYVDDTLSLAARRLRDAREAALSTTNSNTLNNACSYKPSSPIRASAPLPEF